MFECKPKKKIDKTLQLKDSIILQGKVYRTDKMTIKIPGNHPSLWQASPKLVFILSLQLFIASCKAAPAHSQCIRQSIWAEQSGTRMQGVSVRRSTGGTPCHRDVPSAAPRGQRSESGGSLGGSFLTDIIHNQPTQMVFIQMQGQRQACWQCSHPCIGVDRGKSNTHTFLQQPCTFAEVWWGKMVL